MDKLKQLESVVSVVAPAIMGRRHVALLEDFAAPPHGIFAEFAQRKHLPPRVRLWIDFLKHDYVQAAVWTSLACGPQG